MGANGTPEFTTLNGARAYDSTLNACLDLFFETTGSIPEDRLTAMLEAAYAEDALVTLKTICHLGAVRDGKADRLNYYVCMFWLWQRHPRTFLANLHRVPQLVCWKSLLDLLTAAIEGWEPLQERESCRGPGGRGGRGRGGRCGGRGRGSSGRGGSENSSPRPSRRERQRARNKRTRTMRETLSPAAYADFVSARVEKHEAEQREAAAFARVQRTRKKEELRSNAARCLEEDPFLAEFHDQVADMFATQLRQDLASLKAGGRVEGLCGKWAPSPGRSFDRRTGIVDAIVRKLYPAQQYKLEEGTDQQYLSFMRDRYWKEYTTPLRAAAEVPEVKMSAGQWDSIVYERVPSCCMKLNYKHFDARDSERFRAFVQAAKSGTGKKRFAAGALLPHDLVAPFLGCSPSYPHHGQTDDLTDDVHQAQWNRMLADLRQAAESEQGLGSCLPVCDVSGSMYGTPICVAVALSLLASQLAPPPWKDLVCTFSQHPQFVRLQAEDASLRSLCQQVEDVQWGHNTDFNAVFDQLLEVAARNDVPPEGMVKQVLVFSDMEFDHAGGDATNFEEISAKFARAGYAVPKLVFWKIESHSSSKPVVHNTENVALVSGFSKNLLTVFMQSELGEFTPMSTMLDILDHPAFSGLRVVDAGER